MVNAEALLLVDNKKSELTRLNVIRQDPVGSDNDIGNTVFYILQRLLHDRCRNVSGKKHNLQRRIADTLFEVVIVLLCKKCRRREHECLPSVLYAFVYCSKSNFRLTESYVAAQKSIHRDLAFHVALYVLDRSELIVSLDIREILFEFCLPDVIRSACKTLVRTADRIKFNEVKSDALDGIFRALD